MNRRRSFYWALTFLALCLNGSMVSAEDPAGEWQFMRGIQPGSYVCGRASAAPVIDGKLDDVAWQAAAWTDEFLDIEGSKKPKPAYKTQAKMLWDDEFFYIGASLEEPYVWGTLTEHDAVIFQDNDFEVFVDPDGDNHAYYEFEINALNTGWDLFLPKPYKDGGKADNGWEIPGLKTAVFVDGTLNDASDRDKGWSVEIAIPWKAFNRHGAAANAPVGGERWRVSFSRVEWQHRIVDGKSTKVPNTKEDNWVWSPQGIIDMHRPERWGVVEFADQATDALTAKAESVPAVQTALMEVYHRQRVFHAKNKQWASDFAALGLELGRDGLPKGSKLVLTESGYEAFAAESDSPQSLTWHVREDSRLWPKSSNKAVEESLKRAGANEAELRRTLVLVTDEEREGLEFLLANMPDRDLTSLTSKFLVEDLKLAYESWRKAPWKAEIPKEVFLNDLLPYTNINERRDAWRADFRNRFLPLIAEANTPSEAAAMMNQKLFPLVNVRYSTQRPKADQSPYESIKAGTASCTGLSVLLIDACRAVGVPARFVGTPMWSDRSGNHSWLEVWDNGWHFTGACEPAGLELDKAWFIERASTAKRDDPRHAIYAVSFQKTPLRFPLVWDRSIDYVYAVNVTDRYTQRAEKLPEGFGRILVKVIDAQTGQRVVATVQIKQPSGEKILEADSKDERFDANDHLTTAIKLDSDLVIEARVNERVARAEVKFSKNDQLVVLKLADAGTDSK